MADKNTLPVRINPPVFFGATGIIFLLLLFCTTMPEVAGEFFNGLQSSILQSASWYYVTAVAIFLLVVAYLGLSKLGEIKLGLDHSEPEFNNASWFAMLFSAGMGIGLMYFGVAEPMMHYLNPPHAADASVSTAREAMKITFFHWGLHAWSLYAIVALLLAYFSFRHGLPLTLRSALYPLIGDKIYGPVGHAVDIFAILGTVFGVATSLGFGVLQVNAGLNHVFGLAQTQTIQIVLIAVITFFAVISVATGLDKGIRRLSELNLSLAVILVGFVLVLGPTALLLELYVQNTGAYLSDVLYRTFNLYAYEPTDWLGGWTLFYWGWWISWSPFVGMFIARISKGRTIREFVVGVLFVPTGFTFLWMTAFGNSAIDMHIHQGVTALAEAIKIDSSLALFYFLDSFPLSTFLSYLAILMVVVFFVTSSDSGSMVVDMLASGGTDQTPVWQRVFWASLEGVIAIVLLLVGGLQTLQSATIASALPFSLILLLATWGLIKALHIDATKRSSLDQGSYGSQPALGNLNWQKQLQTLVQFPRREHVKRFSETVVQPAMQAVVEELRRHGIDSEVSCDEMYSHVSLKVAHGEEQDFLYMVRPRHSEQPSFVGDEDDESRKYFRAEVFLKEGGTGYDIMGWNKEQVASDIVSQYEKHLHFLHQIRE